MCSLRPSPPPRPAPALTGHTAQPGPARPGPFARVMSGRSGQPPSLPAVTRCAAPPPTRAIRPLLDGLSAAGEQAGHPGWRCLNPFYFLLPVPPACRGQTSELKGPGLRLKRELTLNHRWRIEGGLGGCGERGEEHIGIKSHGKRVRGMNVFPVCRAGGAQGPRHGTASSLPGDDFCWVGLSRRALLSV